ncbi:MAG: response regulator [Cyanobacteria bacterium J06554_6]
MAENRFATQPNLLLSVGSRPRIQVLLIEDSAADARLLEEFLWESQLYEFQMTHVDRLGEALQMIQPRHRREEAAALRCDVILLDLTLPDSDGLYSLERLLAQAGSLPVVVLTNTNDAELAIESVRRGAQDYLVKRQMTPEVLVRSLRYAIERKHQAEALRLTNNALEQRVQERTCELKTANQQLQQEITQRQSAQERLALAQRAGKIGVFEWNIHSNEVMWSAELETLYGVSRGDFGKHHDRWKQSIHAEDRGRVEQDLWQSVTVGQGLKTEFRIVHPAGIRWIAVKSSLFKGDDDEPLRMLGIHMDITDKKQLEAQFLQAQRLESLGALASGIAHDLNNILTPILGVAQLLPLLLKDVDGQTQQLIDMLNCSAQRGTKLVQQILAFARNNPGHRTLLSVTEVLGEIQRIIEQTLPRSIQIQTQLASDLWPIRGDDTQLHQVFMNLCVNARDAMAQGGTLSVSAENLWVDEPYLKMHPHATTSGPYVAVTVTDTGTGIAPDTLARIFDPFFTTKTASQGTGLGLAAVMNIVEGHDGFLAVQSVVEEGTRFQVCLPADTAAAAETAVSADIQIGHQELILVVDDEVAICDVVQLALELHGYRALVTQDGIGAISLLAEHRKQVRCILIDMVMPDMDGRTTIPMLQRLQPQVPIIAMTGAFSPQLSQQLEGLGIQGTLMKPFTTQSLLHKIQPMLGRIDAAEH